MRTSMRLFGSLLRPFSFLLLFVLPFAARAQSRDATRDLAGGSLGPALVKPGRDPNQAVDSEYTKKIHEYTTESFFLSPLVDYLPASSTVPTPKAVLGDIAGARNNLPYSKEVYEYMRLLAKSTPRVDWKSTRLNSSHVEISYAVFCLKKKN